MKVTIDTSYDSLDVALAAVRAAFGASHQDAGGNDPKLDSGNGAGRGKRVAVKRSKRASSRQRGKSSVTSGPSSRSKSSAASSQAGDVRSWARAQGMEVKASGRMPAAVIKAYEDARRS